MTVIVVKFSKKTLLKQQQLNFNSVSEFLKNGIVKTIKNVNLLAEKSRIKIAKRRPHSKLLS
jgi:hypothetical protein